jgi:hypothetical protein
VAIQIHQAICGENQKAWALLKTTMPDVSLAKKIAFRTDLQDTAPAGISWQSVIRGFLFENYYLIIKTFPDTSSDVRKGRVFSHCLIISKSDLSAIDDISILFSFFKDTIDKLAPIEVINYEAGGRYQIPTGLKPRFNKAIRSFVNLQQFNNTIIWVGQENYTQAICSFWQLLTPEEKVNFNFGINFKVDEIPKDKINFITTPETTENKFLNSGFSVIRKSDSETLTEFSEQFLAGEENATKRLQKFLSAIEARPYDRKEISIIAKGISTFEKIDSVTDIKLLNTLSHIIAEYSPDPKKGEPLKDKVIKRLSLLIESTIEPKELLLLKTFKIKSYKDSEKELGSSVGTWLNKNLFSLDANNKNNFLAIFSDFPYNNIASWWDKLIDKKMKSFLSKKNPTVAAVVWQWVIYEKHILSRIQDSISSIYETETNFIDTLPNDLKEISFDVLNSFAVEKKWLRLNAVIFKYFYSPEKALTELLKIDANPKHLEAIHLLTNNVKSHAIIDFAIANPDIRLIDMAANNCVQETELLEKIDVANSTWQQIWYVSSKRGLSVTNCFKNPQKIIYKLFDLVSDGKEVNKDLLEAISQSNYANILSYPKRNKMWSNLPEAIKNKFFEKTAAALLESAGQSSAFEIPSDKELLNYIVSSNSISTFLYYNRNNIKVALPVFSAFNLAENNLRDYIYNYNGNIEVIDATQLGKLTMQKSYNQVAQAIYSKSTHTNNWKIALAESYSLLGYLSRMSIAYTGLINNVAITKDQWWEAMKETAMKLYPGGPMDKKIWTQADGEEFDLLTRGTGKEIWIDALNKLRRGGFNGITVNKLLAKMLKEHSRNNELKTLKELKDKI